MRVEYLPQARADILRTLDYLINKLSAPQAAEDLMDEIDAAAQSLLQFPYSYPLYRTTKPLRSEIRYVTVKNYVLYYAVLDDVIQIRRFLHGRQDRENMKY